jgi:hypothetical protein
MYLLPLLGRLVTSTLSAVPIVVNPRFSNDWASQ